MCLDLRKFKCKVIVITAFTTSSVLQKMYKKKGQTTEINLLEAEKFLPNADFAGRLDFAERQYRSRLRFAGLKSFYKKYYCRLTRLHLLATCAVTLGRFAGFSKTFDEMGENFLPFDETGEPRNTEWLEYAKSCEENLPLEVREELWLVAHFKDLQNVRENGLYAAFEREASDHKDEPVWQFLQQHMDVALGVRMMDNSAISGLMPYETAFADSLVLTINKLVTVASKLVFLYTKESARAVLNFSERTPSGLISYRRTAFEMLGYFLNSFTVSKIFRRGIRNRERGKVASDENWTLLEMSLGEEVEKINPLIREFYGNPSHFDVTASLNLETLPARFWSRFITLLLGQGLYETNLKEIPARLRIFARLDGSMHFIRELYCNGKFRIFDSDFVVKNGKLYEIFTDLKTSVELHVEPSENGGLLIKSRNFFFHGKRMPSLGLIVEFKSRVAIEKTLRIQGDLMIKPKTKMGRMFAYKVLRRPKDLGSIRYTIQKRQPQ